MYDACPLPREQPEIPAGLRPHFQEYDPEQLDFTRDADLIIQRTLDFGTWEEVRWLLGLYGMARIRQFLRRQGERWLKPVTFNYWRKLLGVRKWASSPLPTGKGKLWSH